MHGLTRITVFVQALWDVQQGLCFHCGEPMVLKSAAGVKKALFATREHIYPRGNGGKRRRNNWVLAHYRCNHERGSTPPTLDQIAKAKAIYAILGLEPFTFNDAFDAVHARWENGKPYKAPKIADLIPEWKRRLIEGAEADERAAAVDGSAPAE